MLPRRKLIVAGLGTTAALVLGGRYALKKVARAADLDEPLTPAAKLLVDRAWEGLDPARVLDSHVHLVGTGAGGTGCWVHPNMLRPLRHPISSLKFAIYLHASGVVDEDKADIEYVDRLALLVRSQQRHGKLLLLPFDQVHAEDGTPLPDQSEMYTPNDYALAMAKANPDVFLAATSVHPYRKDAAEELERCIAAGAIAMKWLPNAHRIDPSSPRCDKVYEVLARTGVPLITHGGEEQAVHAEEAQALGNPLHLRRALDRGVKVIVAHGASLGTDADLEAPDKPRLPSRKLLYRLLERPEYVGRLFVDLSAVCQYNRCGEPLAELLSTTALHPRYVNGSDYPLPAINALVRTGALESYGYITAEERAALNAIDRHNPLLYDFVLKRTLKHNGARFPDSAFQVPPGLFPSVA